MNRIYEAENGVEAHMLKDLLEREGIDAQVEGEFLQGAVGGIPPVGLVGIQVNESDIEKAKEIIASFERSQPNIEPVISSQVKDRSSSNIISFILGISLGVAGTLWAYNSPEEIINGSSDEKNHLQRWACL